MNCVIDNLQRLTIFTKNSISELLIYYSTFYHITPVVISFIFSLNLLFSLKKAGDHIHSLRKMFLLTFISETWILKKLFPWKICKIQILRKTALRRLVMCHFLQASLNVLAEIFIWKHQNLQLHSVKLPSGHAT